jgi:hypothetical protein
MLGDQWVYAASSWVQRYKVNGENGPLVVQFNNGFCCQYPATDINTFELMLCWPSKGKFLHQFLVRHHWPYIQIPPPPGA